jgi:fatty acid desaturase
MSEKEQVLEQLDEIESSLVDSQKFMPYNYNILILWGIVSAILFLSFETIVSFNIYYALLFIFITIVITIFIEQYHTRKENKKYDIDKYTKKQKFIESLYMFSAIISLILTYIFVSNNIASYTYLIWMFMIAFSHHTVGYVLNNKYFSTVAIINLAVVFSIFTISFIFSIDMFADYIKYLAVIFSSFGCIYIGYKSKKEF